MKLPLTIAISDAASFENEGKTVMYMAVDGVHSAMIAVADTLKETSKQAIKELKAAWTRCHYAYR